MILWDSKWCKWIFKGNLGHTDFFTSNLYISNKLCIATEHNKNKIMNEEGSWAKVQLLRRQFELVWSPGLTLSQWQANSSDSDWTFDYRAPIWEARVTWSYHCADMYCICQKNQLYFSVSVNWFCRKVSTVFVKEYQLYLSKSIMYICYCHASLDLTIALTAPG